MPGLPLTRHTFTCFATPLPRDRLCGQTAFRTIIVDSPPFNSDDIKMTSIFFNTELRPALTIPGRSFIVVPTWIVMRRAM